MTIKLYDFELSGNCYKVRLLMSFLGLEHELVPVNFMAGEHKSPKLLRLNSLGQVPVLTDGDLVLADSQAILVYLARKYGNETWLPNDIEAVTEKSTIMLQQLEQHLTDRKWLELGHSTIADIAMFPYVALAPDGKIPLKPYPQILAWCDRFKQLPGFISMPGI
jgi:glutathione S-transferase